MPVVAVTVAGLMLAQHLTFDMFDNVCNSLGLQLSFQRKAAGLFEGCLKQPKQQRFGEKRQLSDIRTFCNGGCDIITI